MPTHTGDNGCGEREIGDGVAERLRVVQVPLDHGDAAFRQFPGGVARRVAGQPPHVEVPFAREQVCGDGAALVTGSVFTIVGFLLVDEEAVSTFFTEVLPSENKTAEFAGGLPPEAMSVPLPTGVRSAYIRADSLILVAAP
jgi:hypothetical protein